MSSDGARRVGARAQVCLSLVTTTPLHVGGMGGDADVDLAVALDGLGRAYIPGTSLAGAFRDWMRDADRGESKELRSLWGFIKQQEGGDIAASSDAGAADRSRGGQASRVVLDDAIVYACQDDCASETVRPIDDLVDVRASVGIDRRTGTAADRSLYSRAVLRAGSVLCTTLTVEEADRAGLLTSLAHVARLLGALTRGEVTLGAAASRGLGRVEMVKELTRITIEDLRGPGGIIARLRRDPSPLTEATLRAFEQGTGWRLAACGAPAADLLQSLVRAGASSPGTPRRWMDVCIRWKAAGPLMVRASIDGFGIDSLPLTNPGVGGVRRLVVPGSSIKGALRTRAERIVRTVLGSAHVTPSKFLDQLESVLLVPALFGSSGSLKCGAIDKSVAGKSAVLVGDCEASVELSADDWKELLVGGQPDPTDEDARLSRVLRTSLSAKGLRQADHIAIDRWTGGPSQGALYSVLEPWDISWPPIRLRIDVDRLRRVLAPPSACGAAAVSEHRTPPAHTEPAEQPVPEVGPQLGAARTDDGAASADAAIGLLLLTLGELCSGSLPIGFAVNRGMGDVCVSSVTIAESGGASPEDERTNRVEITPIDPLTPIDPFSDESMRRYRTAWISWASRMSA